MYVQCRSGDMYYIYTLLTTHVIMYIKYSPFVSRVSFFYWNVPLLESVPVPGEFSSIADKIKKKRSLITPKKNPCPGQFFPASLTGTHLPSPTDLHCGEHPGERPRTLCFPTSGVVDRIGDRIGDWILNQDTSIGGLRCDQPRPM